MSLNDPNYGYTTPRDPEAMRPSTSMWGILAVAGILIIGGLFFFSSGTTPERTASNAPSVTRTTPAPTPAPAPVPTPAAPKQ